MFKFFATDASSSANRWIGFSKNIQRSIHVSNTNNSLHVPIGNAVVVKGRESVLYIIGIVTMTLKMKMATKLL